MAIQPRDSDVRICKSHKCARQVLWIKVEGKKICVDPRRTRLYYSEPATQDPWSRGELGYISHFLTCADPEKFSKGRSD